MAVVVLVHGAWHWGGCWSAVQSLLEQQGCEVYSPSLTLQPGCTLNTHVEQVVELIREHDLEQIVLVGHSYGGIVVAGVLARLPARIHHTVFLDAFLPEPGRTPLDALVPRAGMAVLRGLARLQPMWPSFVSAEGFGIHDPSSASWIDSNLRPHPAETFMARFPYAPAFEPDRCTYVACLEPIRITDQGTVLGRIMARMITASPLTVFAQRAAAAGWHTVDLPVGHNAMVIAPSQVAEIINAVLPTDTLPALAERAVGG
ncbi:MAG: alpha/beta hydrolase [Kouleothrix sp.]